MSTGTALKGFADPVLESQAAFRHVMMAMAEPGTIHQLDIDLAPPAPLMPGAAALALTLCDFESTIWLDPTFAAAPEVHEFLAFHTGAPLAAGPGEAAFAFIAEASGLPSLKQFSFGSLEYPDHSTTLIVQASSLTGGDGWSLTGPGIVGAVRLAVGGVPLQFAEERRSLRASFPLGLDVIFVAGSAIAALPRSTILA